MGNKQTEKTKRRRKKRKYKPIVEACLSKDPYRYKQDAINSARVRERQTGATHWIYECPHCFNWHLTSGGFVGQEASGDER